MNLGEASTPITDQPWFRAAFMRCPAAGPTSSNSPGPPFSRVSLLGDLAPAGRTLLRLLDVVHFLPLVVDELLAVVVADLVAGGKRVRKVDTAVAAARDRPVSSPVARPPTARRTSESGPNSGKATRKRGDRRLDPQIGQCETSGAADSAAVAGERPDHAVGSRASSRMTRAGIPTAREFAGMSFVTTAPAPTTELSPM